MGGKPVGPWRAVDEGDDPVPLGPYENAPHLFKYAQLYRAVAQASGGTIGPDTVNGWESWETAAYLGVGLPLPEGAEPGTNVDPRSPEVIIKEKQAYFEALQKAQRDGGPPPEMPASLRPVERVMPAAGVLDMQPMDEVG